MDIYISLIVSKLQMFFICLLAICISYLSNCLLIVLVSLLICCLLSCLVFGSLDVLAAGGGGGRWKDGSVDKVLAHTMRTCVQKSSIHIKKKSWHDGAWVSSWDWSAETGVCQD